MQPKKQIHILIIPSWLPTRYNPFGGIFILDQARAIQRHTDTNVGIIYRQDFTLNMKHHILPGALDAFNHVVVTKPYTPKVNVTTIRIWSSQYHDAYRRYVEAYGRPDIIHAHSYIAGFGARYISRTYGIPFILTEHLGLFVDRKIKAAHTATLRKVLCEANRVVAVSEFLRKAMAQYTARDIQVVPNLYNEEIFTPLSTSPSRHFTIVAVGDLIPIKAFDLLIESFSIAYHKDNDLRLEIVGSGSLRRNLEKQVRDADLRSRVTFHGGANAKEVAAVFQASDLCISTSYTETFGITLIEAMGCGLPVIATPSGGPYEIITSKNGVLVEDRNPTSIATAMVDMKHQRDSFPSSSIAKYAKRNYGSKVISGEIHGLYCSVLKNIRKESQR